MGTSVQNGQCPYHEPSHGNSAHPNDAENVPDVQPIRKFLADSHFVVICWLQANLEGLLGSHARGDHAAPPPSGITWDPHPVVRQEVIVRGYDDRDHVRGKVKDDEDDIKSALPPPKLPPIDHGVADKPAGGEPFSRRGKAVKRRGDQIRRDSLVHYSDQCQADKDVVVAVEVHGDGGVVVKELRAVQKGVVKVCHYQVGEPKPAKDPLYTGRAGREQS